MSGLNLAPHSVRPLFTRSRSHTTPSQNSAVPAEAEEAPAKPSRPPSSGRANSFSPNTKPSEARTTPANFTFDTASTHSKSHRHHVLRHRHTQSEAHKQKEEVLPHLTSKLIAERNAPKHRPVDALGRLESQRSYLNGHGASGEASVLYPYHGNQQRRRASSDPKPVRQRPKGEVEQALDRAYAMKLSGRAATTKADVDHLKQRREDAEEELRDKLSRLNQTGTDITRRLDYTYYSLLEKIGSLVSTIGSFQSLSKQSHDLIENFSKEATALDSSTRGRTETFREGFDVRQLRVAELEGRGVKAQEKATKLSDRLESARKKVQEWESREAVAVKKRERWWKGVWGTVGTILGIIVLIICWKEWMGAGDPVQAGLGTHWRQLVNGSDAPGRAEVPDDVKGILREIGTRHKSHMPLLSSLAPASPTAKETPDTRLRVFDEL